jgi:hypothetical protein
VDIEAVQAALRITSPAQLPTAAALADALAEFEDAVRRSAAAETEASICRRPSTLKATLKAATAVSRARADLMTELRRLGELQDRRDGWGGQPPLHLCG